MEDLMMEKLQLLKPENSDKYDLQYMKDAGYIKRNNAELHEILNKRRIYLKFSKKIITTKA